MLENGGGLGVGALLYIYFRRIMYLGKYCFNSTFFEAKHSEQEGSTAEVQKLKVDDAVTLAKPDL